MNPILKEQGVLMTAFVLASGIPESLVRRAIKLGYITPKRLTPRLFLFDTGEIPSLREKMITAGILKPTASTPVAVA